MQGDLAYGRPGTANPDRIRSLFGQTMGLVAVTAGCFTLAAYVNRGSSYEAGCDGYIAVYACLVVMKFTVRRSMPTATVLLLTGGPGRAETPSQARQGQLTELNGTARLRHDGPQQPVV